MKLLAKFIGAFVANGATLFVADRFLDGFMLAPGLYVIAIVALILTALNLLLKPVLKLILIPFIILTLGLGLIVINTFILYILDILSESLTIDGILTLIYATLIMSAVNFIVHLFIRK